MRAENKMAGNKGSVGAKSVGGKSKPAGSGSGGNANAKSIQSRSQRAGLQVGHSSFYALCVGVAWSVLEEFSEWSDGLW